MNEQITPFRRPRLARTGPKRTAAHAYRAASDNPDVRGGFAPGTGEAAAVAGVRLGYKIAYSLFESAERVGTRLREAGDQAVRPEDPQAGSDSRRVALDATEQLVFKAVMSGLSWFEGLAADQHNPIKRLASAQFQLLGSLFGLAPSGTPEPRSDPAAAPPPPIVADDHVAAMREKGAKPRSSLRDLPMIRHEQKAGRPVQVRQWELADDAMGDYPLTFFKDEGAVTLSGVLSVPIKGVPMLAMTGKTAGGTWRAAICDETGLQLGFVEVAL